jgi:diguanylate cyclase (GGDEF)-like protein
MDAFAQYGITTDLLEEAFPFFVACDQDFRIAMLGPSLRELSPSVAIGTRLIEHGSVLHLATDMRVDSAEAAKLKRRDENDTVSINWLSDKITLCGRMSCRDHGFLFLVTPAASKVELPNSHTSSNANGFLQSHQSISHDELKRLVLRLERAAAEKEHRNETERQLVDTLEAAGDLCIHFDQQRRIIDIKVASQAYLGTHPVRLTMQKLAHVLPNVDRAINDAADLLQKGLPPLCVAFQLDCDTSDFQFEGKLATTKNGDYVLLARDVTERCQLEKRLEHRTLHDPLTGLANRTQFQLNASHALEQGKNIAVLLADMDDFKSINDGLGEEFGDSLLKVLAERILNFTRDTDTAFRIGADEFGILLSSDCPLEFAESIAHRLTEELCKPVRIDDVEVDPQVSIGLAVGSPGQSFEATIRDAGFALERAKSHKKTSIVICDDAVRDQLQERNTMKRDISRAIRQHEFVVFYQPIIGFEALVRWDHPSRGLLSPFFFLDIAEETGAIVDIGEQVLETACRDLQEIGTLFPDSKLKVNVNLASQQVQDVRLVQLINDVLSRTKLDPSKLTLEITESALIEDFEKAKRVIGSLREKGMQIALDDFGAGHSSLTYLQQLPLDYLKLDRALISSVCESSSQRAITECVTKLGKALQLKVVAEGIETEDQHKMVDVLGCDMAQGFLFSKPVPLEQAIELLVSEMAFGTCAPVAFHQSESSFTPSTV